MSIWFEAPELADAAQLREGTMVSHLGIRITGVDDDSLTGTMPVDDRTRQPHGLLHGGASVALAETLGSIAANLVVDRERFYCVGLEINANHLRAVRSGIVTGTARPLHLGRSTQVWQIDIRDEGERLCCISRLTMQVLERR